MTTGAHTQDDLPTTLPASAAVGTLADLAQRVNALHGQIMGALRKSVQAAIEIGSLLADAKRQTGHGGFGRWLSENVQFSSRTARRYMTVYEHRDRLLKSDSVSDLQSAYRLLSEHVEPESDHWGNAIGEAETESLAFKDKLNDPTATATDMVVIMRRAREIEKKLTRYQLEGERAMGELLNTLTPEPGCGYLVECPLYGDSGKDVLFVMPALPEGYFWVNFMQMGPGEDEGCMLDSFKRPVRRDGVDFFAAFLLREPARYREMLKREMGVMEPSRVNPFGEGCA